MLIRKIKEYSGPISIQQHPFYSQLDFSLWLRNIHLHSNNRNDF